MAAYNDPMPSVSKIPDAPDTRHAIYDGHNVDKVQRAVPRYEENIKEREVFNTDEMLEAERIGFQKAVKAIHLFASAYLGPTHPFMLALRSLTQK